MSPSRSTTGVIAAPLLSVSQKVTAYSSTRHHVEAAPIPLAVAEEVGAGPDGKATLQLIAVDPVFVIAENEVPTLEIMSWDLGAGETQVILNARIHGADRVVIDDLAARRCAQAMGLKIIGTLGLVGRAKVMGLIDRAAPLVRRLRESGLYASDELIERLLREVGE
jgi:predicted nucleic acid-binding protein